MQPPRKNGMKKGMKRVGGQRKKPLPKARDIPEPDLEDVLEYQKG